MDDSDFQEKKKCKAGPKNLQKTKTRRPRKQQKQIKGQKDIRALIKNKDSDLVSYAQDFDQVCKNSGIDVDSEQLQLAIALSKSLHEVETKCNDISQEKTPSSSQERTTKIRITLQEYGFKVKNSGNTKITKDRGKRKKLNKQYKLLLVSNEEKQQNISDKYAEVLARNIHKSPLKHNRSSNSNNNNDHKIFNKATHILYEDMKNDDVFYVHELFEKPLSKSSLLRDWAEIPGRPVSPKREVSHINFDDVYCTQEELDYMLNGSIHTAQNIIKNKILNTIYKSNDVKNTSPNKVTEEENNTAIRSDIHNITKESEVESNLEKEIIMEPFVNNFLAVTQKARSLSPDLFDDEISLITDDTNNSIKNTQESLSKTENNVVDYMDLTECVNFVPIASIKNLSRNRNVTNRTNDLMEITDCISTSARQFCRESIDLTQYCDYSNKIDKENLKIDLSQSLFGKDIPAIKLDGDENSLDTTFIINLVEPKQNRNKETLLQKDSDIVLICENKAEETSKSFVDKEGGSSNDPVINSNKITLNIEDNLVVHQTQLVYCDNKLPLVKVRDKNENKSSNLIISEDFETNTNMRETCIENIDLTQNCDLNEVSDKPEKINLNILLTQTLSPDYDFHEAEDDNSNPEKSLDTTIIIDDNVESKRIHKETLRKDVKVKVLCVSETNKTEEKSKLINNKNNMSSCCFHDSIHIKSANETDHDHKDNNSDKINSNNIENQNILDLTQSSGSDDETLPLITDMRNEKTLEKTIPRDEYVETNSHSISSDQQRLQCNDKILLNDDNSQQLQEDNKLDIDNRDIGEQNISYIYDEYIYNNSLNFDYIDSNYSFDELQDDTVNNDNGDKVFSCEINENQKLSVSLIESKGTLSTTKQNIDSTNIEEQANVDLIHNSNISSETLESQNTKYTLANENSHIEGVRSNSNNTEKNIDYANIGEPANFDLTQDSDSSDKTIENHIKTYDNNNLGKIGNVSIDYDDMFDDVMSASSKSASMASIKSNNISHKQALIEQQVNEDSNKTSDFELSDKELNYSLHQSRYNFDIGGLSVFDNVPDITQSIKEYSRQSNLDKSLNDCNLPTVTVKAKKTTGKIDKANFVSETSTTLILNKNLLKEVQQTPKNNEYIIKTNNVTPMMDYETMTSPERNRELEKYGLKPFKRKRAIQLLTHLYNQTHPIVENCDVEESSPLKKRKLDNKPNSYKSPEKPMKSPRQLFSEVNEVNKENIVYEVTKENPDIRELKCEPEDWVFQNREKAKVHSCKVPLHIAFHNYVSCRQLLREAILKYEPINIDVVHKDLVACGYRYNPKDLLKFMDKKCITVKTADNNTRNKKT